MTDKLVTFDTAKLAKEKGFDRTSWFGNDASLYSKEGEHVYYSNYGMMGSGLMDGYIKAPTQTLLQKWLREEHKVNIFIIPEFRSGKCNYDSYKLKGYRAQVHKSDCIFVIYCDYNIFIESEWKEEQESEEDDSLKETFDEWKDRMSIFISDDYELVLEKALEEGLKLI